MTVATILRGVVSESGWPKRQCWPARFIRFGAMYVLLGLGFAVWQAVGNTRWEIDWGRVWITIGLTSVVVGAVWLAVAEWRHRRR